MSVHRRFVVELQSAYEHRVASYCHAGLSPEDAHGRAFLEVKALGAQAIAALRHRGLYPFRDADPPSQSSERES